MARQCNFCNNSDAGYTCPRCGLFYCSINCYKHPNHSECSESFYKDLVLQELSSNPDPKLKEITLKLLTKLNLDEESQADNFVEKLSTDDLSLSGKNLPAEERQKFEKLIKNGGIFNLLPAHFWDPWYCKFSQRMVTKVTSSGENDDADGDNDNELEDDSYEADVEEIPDYPTNLPSLQEITKQQVSPLIKCSVVQTIFAYCAVCRYFTGDHHADPFEAYNLFIKLSSIDCHKISFPTTGQCLQSACRKLIENYKFPLCFIEKLYADTALIIKSGKRVILRIMVDIIKLCKKASNRKKDQAKAIHLIKKKVKFYASWCTESETILKNELPEIIFETFSFKSMINEHQQQEQQLKASKSSREQSKKLENNLIEILDS